MATSSRYRSDEDEGRPRRRAAKKTGPPLVPILALVVLIVGAIVLARIAAQDRGETVEPPKVEASNIFGDLPEETPPTPGAGGAGRARTTNLAPTGLANNQVWIEALHKAEEAEVLFAQGKQARSGGDRAKWNELGNQAKALYNEALEMTAVWEDELREEFGDTDRQVRDIMRKRSQWFERLDTLLKTTGRG